MEKKILASLMVIGLVATLAGAGLYAYFNDTEESTGNIFQAGTLDLVTGGLPITLYDMAPGMESDPYTVTLENVGSLPGHVSWEITAIDEADGTNPPEFQGDVTADDFAAKVYVTYVVFDRDCDGTCEPLTGDETSYGYINPTTGGIKGPGETPVEADVAVNVETWWTEFTDVQRKDFIATAGWEGAPHPSGFDEWVLPDWIRWGSYLHGTADGYLSIYEIDLVSWDIDDSGEGDASPTTELDPGDTYTHWLKFTLDSDVGNDFQADGISVTVEFTLTQA